MEDAANLLAVALVAAKKLMAAMRAKPIGRYTSINRSHVAVSYTEALVGNMCQRSVDTINRRPRHKTERNSAKLDFCVMHDAT